MSMQASDIAAASSARRYTSVAIILHWVIALAIIVQLAGGRWMVSAGAAATGSVFAVFQIHKTVGLTVLALTLARIIWRLAHPAPALPSGMNQFEKLAAALTHIGFYALLILLPLSGWAMASVSPTGVPTFFLLLESLPFAHLPLLGEAAGLPERHSAEAFLKDVHNLLALAMAALIVLHIAAALKHQFIARDHLIARMILSARSLPQSAARPGIGLLAGLATLGFLGGGIVWGLAQKDGAPTLQTAELGDANVTGWVVDHDRSALSFFISFTGNPVVGEVANWSAQIDFDPDDLISASALISIDTSSIMLANSTLQAQSAGSDGFDTANHALATYQATTFSRNDDGSFTAAGTLTVRGVSVDTPLTFSFDERDGTAFVEGSAELNRLDFGVGTVGAANEAWLLHAVTVNFSIQASRSH